MSENQDIGPVEAVRLALNGRRRLSRDEAARMKPPEAARRHRRAMAYWVLMVLFQDQPFVLVGGGLAALTYLGYILARVIMGFFA